MASKDNAFKLRAEAEVKMKEMLSKPFPHGCADPTSLLHELQVHQIELEMQNETLRKSQVSLEESRDRFVNFYDFAPAGYITLSCKGMITEVNLTTTTLLGRDRNKLVNSRFSHFVAPEERDHWYRFLLSAINVDNKLSCETVLERSDGTRLNVQLDCLRLLKEGNPPEIRIVMSDISERRRLEFKLLESEKRRHQLEQQEIVQTSQDGFWVVNANNGELRDVNDNYCNFVGYTKQEILKMGIQDLDAIETPEENKARIKRIQEVGYDRFETRHRHKQGHLIDFEVSVTHSEVDGGVNFAFFHDITVRNRTLEILKRSEESYRLLFESSRDALVTASAHPPFSFISVNNAAVELFRAKSIAEIIGKQPWELSPERQPDGLKSTVKTKQMIEFAIQNGSNFFEWTHRRLDGEAFSTEILLTCLEQNGQSCIQATIRDITDRKRVEEIINQSRDQLKTFIEQAPIRIAMLDRNMNYLAVSGGWFRDYNNRHADLIGLNHYEVRSDSISAHCQTDRTRKGCNEVDH